MERLRRGFVFLLTAGMAFAIPVYLYYHHLHGAGHSVTDAQPLGDPKTLWNYIYIGTQVGTVLRGLALFPSLGIDELDAMLMRLCSYVTHTGDIRRALRIYANFGAYISFAFLIAALLVKPRRKNVCCWCLGQALMFGAFLLPAFGRWQLGVNQSLSLRYQYQALPGLYLIMLPALMWLLRQTQVGAEKRVVNSSLHAGAVAALLLLLVGYFSVNLLLEAQPTYFTSVGGRNYDFAMQLRSWHVKMDRPAAKGEDVTAGAGTQLTSAELSSLGPVLPATLTPGRSADTIYNTLRWLK